jgi:hypothetical protein
VHYWRVRGVNSLGIAGAWSGARVLTVDTIAPNVPTLVDPINYSVLTVAPTYKWNASTGANAYLMQFDFHADHCSSPSADYVSPMLSTTSHKPVTQMKGLYYWCVKARDAAGNWSSFTVPFKLLIGSPLLPM